MYPTTPADQNTCKAGRLKKEEARKRTVVGDEGAESVETEARGLTASPVKEAPQPPSVNHANSSQQVRLGRAHRAN